MTSQSPRIYIYKITFEEVPYYYYGVHKEKVFGEEYWGSPYTNKWCWELYTPVKQILELFEYNDEGWKQALSVEKRIIKEFYRIDRWCLNKNCGGNCYLLPDKRRELNLQINKNLYENGKGIFSISVNERKKINKKSDETNKIKGTGIYSIPKEQQIEYGKNWGKKGSKKTNSQKWMCLETGFITTPGPLTHYQKARNIDTSKRKQVS